MVVDIHATPNATQHLQAATTTPGKVSSSSLYYSIVNHARLNIFVFGNLEVDLFYDLIKIRVSDRGYGQLISLM